MLKNKFEIENPVELARLEEKISKQKGIMMEEIIKWITKSIF